MKMKSGIREVEMALPVFRKKDTFMYNEKQTSMPLPG
jgi:hypothetical protein